MNVWMTSILIAPLLLIVFMALQEGAYWNWGFISLYILFVFAGVVLSLPSIFLHKLAFRELADNIRSVILLQALLSIISIFTLSFTYVIIEKYAGSGYEKDVVIPLFCFDGTVIFSSFIHKVRIEEAKLIT